MPDLEADILEAFIAGFRAGKKTVMAEIEKRIDNRSQETEQQAG